MKYALSILLALASVLAAGPALAIPRPGDSAPAFSLPTVNGTTVSPDAFRGKPVYLNFFATWCGPCRVETPSIAQLSRKYARSGLSVVGVDVGENVQKARGFVHDFSLPYQVAVDADNSTRISYGGGLYFPLHVFIDRHGIVRIFHPGEMSAPEIEAAIKTISK